MSLRVKQKIAKLAFLCSLILVASSVLAIDSLTGGKLVALSNGSESDKQIAANYIGGVADALDEVDFCRPYKFQPEKLFGALEIQLTYNPFFYRQSGDLLVREVLVKLTPCSKKSKTLCVCLNRNSE